MRVSNAWNRLVYGIYAPFYDWVAAPFEAGREHAVDRLDLDGTERVLVPGCGTGLDLEYLPAGTDVTAIDATPTMVERTAARASTLPLSVEAREADATALDVADDTYDVVLCHLVLSVVPDPEALIREASRVLKPDGRISIYDKFVPVDEPASMSRRAANPLARRAFADLTRSLDPLLEVGNLEAGERDYFLGGVYLVTVARPR